MQMRYDGPDRTVMRAGRSYDLENGEAFDAHSADRRFLEQVGATALEEPGEPRALSDRTVDELRELAADAEIEGRSTMTKAELIDALEEG